VTHCGISSILAGLTSVRDGQSNPVKGLAESKATEIQLILQRTIWGNMKDAKFNKLELEEWPGVTTGSW
jgi:hypothetical protein